MWTLRRFLRISWTKHMSNEEILLRVNAHRQLLDVVKQQETSYLGHISREPEYILLKIILIGKIEGKRRPGRRQHSWLRNIRIWCDIRRCHFIQMCRRGHDSHCAMNAYTLHWAYDTIRRRRRYIKFLWCIYAVMYFFRRESMSDNIATQRYVMNYTSLQFARSIEVWLWILITIQYSVILLLTTSFVVLLSLSELACSSSSRAVHPSIGSF